MAGGLATKAQVALRYSVKLTTATLQVGRNTVDLPLTSAAKERLGADTVAAEIQAIVCGPLAIIGLLLWRRWSSPLPTLLQVNLSGAGCVEIDHVSLRRARGLTPWTKLDRIDIEELDGDRHRLRVGKHANWFGLAPALTVDAEVKCSPAQARALRDRIALWRDEAAASARTGGFPVVLES